MSNLKNIQILILISITLFITLPLLSLQNILKNIDLVKKYNIRQIREGIENGIVPERENKAIVEMKIHDKSTLKLVFEGFFETSVFSSAIPKCLDQTIIYMSVKERIVLDCPAEYAFNEMNYNRYPGVEIGKDYIFDYQVWNIGGGTYALE